MMRIVFLVGWIFGFVGHGAVIPPLKESQDTERRKIIQQLFERSFKDFSQSPASPYILKDRRVVFLSKKDLPDGFVPQLRGYVFSPETLEENEVAVHSEEGHRWMEISGTWDGHVGHFKIWNWYRRIPKVGAGYLEGAGFEYEVTRSGKSWNWRFLGKLLAAS